MNSKIFVTAAAIVFLLTCGQAYSQDPGDEGKEEATMRLMDRMDATLPEEVTNNIALPAAEDLQEEAADVLIKYAKNEGAIYHPGQL